ncbi:MAG: hypothetical protein ACTHN3_10950 [Solirubrobacterales bacterium]
MAKLFLAACGLALLLVAVALAGHDLTAPHFVGPTAIIAAVGWLWRT